MNVFKEGISTRSFMPLNLNANIENAKKFYSVGIETGKANVGIVLDKTM